jgi:hypothetical protein
MASTSVPTWSLEGKVAVVTGSGKLASWFTNLKRIPQKKATNR